MIQLSCGVFNKKSCHFKTFVSHQLCSLYTKLLEVNPDCGNFHPGTADMFPHTFARLLLNMCIKHSTGRSSNRLIQYPILPIFYWDDANLTTIIHYFTQRNDIIYFKTHFGWNSQRSWCGVYHFFFATIIINLIIFQHQVTSYCLNQDGN